MSSSNLDGFRDSGRWLYSYCFMACCFQDLFNIALSILVQLLFSFFLYTLSQHPHGYMDMTAAWRKLHFILSNRSYFHMTESLSIAIHTFVSHVLMSFPVDEMLLLR